MGENMADKSYFERTGKLGPKIDVYRQDGTAHGKPSGPASYLHSTCWHRTCREAVQDAAVKYGMKPGNLFARFDKPVRT